MIKNAAAVLCALALLACRKGSGTPEGYQGIVELDLRVLAFEVAGRVMTVPVKRGDLVKEGSVVAQLDDTLEALTRAARADEETVARADLALLEAGARREDIGAVAAQVKAAAAVAEAARKNAERTRALHASGSLPQEQLDRAEAEADRAAAEHRSLEQRLSALTRGARTEEIARAKARVETAQTVLELADARLARYELKSQEDGMVLDVHVKSGELAGVGTPAATIADVTHPFVDVFVPVGALGGVRLGTRAEIRIDAQPSVARGEIEYISPKTEFTPRFLFSERERPNLVIRVRVRVHDDDRVLLAGVPAFVRFLP